MNHLFSIAISFKSLDGEKGTFSISARPVVVSDIVARELSREAISVSGEELVFTVSTGETVLIPVMDASNRVVASNKPPSEHVILKVHPGRIVGKGPIGNSSG